jgi:hypothetical protein
VADNGHQQRGFALELQVEAALGNADLARDVVDGCLPEPELLEVAAHNVQDALASAGISASRRLPRWPRLGEASTEGLSG